MFRVEETLPDGRRRTMTVRPVPAGTSGPVLVAGGSVSGRPAIPVPRPPADDMLALAVAVGVMA